LFLQNPIEKILQEQIHIYSRYYWAVSFSKSLGIEKAS